MDKYSSAIEIFEIRKEVKGLCPADEVALSALLEAQERGNPKPLTLEELRERDGKPVYCVAVVNKGLTGWGLVNASEEMIFDSHEDYWSFAGYGKHYNAYDHVITP